MKIIATVTNDLSADQRMHRICETLAEEGFEVTLVGRLLNSSERLVNQKYQQIRIRCFFNSGKMFYLEFNLRLMFFLLFRTFDVVNSVDMDTVFPGYLISKLKGSKVVLDCHELFSEVPEVERRKNIQWVWRSLEQFIIPKIKYKYTVSESLVKYYEKQYSTKFLCVRNMPLKRVLTKQIDAEPYMLYQGALNEGRGLEQLVKSMVNIDFKLMIVGSGDVEGNLKQLVNDLNLQNKVIFTGFVSPSELIEITNNAFFGLNFLEKRSLSYYYSLANKFFDYVQGEVPQITMNFPEYRLLNQQHEVALLIDNLSQDTIINAITKLCEDTSCYEMLKNGSKLAKVSWNWGVEREKLTSLYANLD